MNINGILEKKMYYNAQRSWNIVASSNSLVSSDGSGWIFPIGDIPEPVIMMLQLIRYTRANCD